MKTIVTTLTLAFASISIAIFVFKVTQPDAFRRISDAIAMEKNIGSPESSGKLQQKGHQVIAYYFHTALRCTTCFTMERYTQEAILTGFPDDIRSGRLVWKAINVDDEENEHFVRDYELYTKSVVIVDMQDGVQVRWKNLKDIWDLVDDKKAFIDYIQAETGSYLEKN